MINDDVAPAVITKIRLAIILIVNSGCHVRGMSPVGFPKFFVARPTSFPGAKPVSEEEKESAKW